uniref:General transcription factor IIH subunit 4 n=1 Tax=Romanomermis culicivorax TaxID=13658 RepID=A0A915K3Y5_ROMCU
MAETTGIDQFLTYLKQLPSSCFQALYESPATCVAILSDILAVFDTLRSLHILVEKDDTVRLVPAFGRGLKQALFCGKLSGLEDVTVEEKYRKTCKDLNNYGVERWECILKYMALPSVETQKAVSQENRQILNAAGFIKLQGSSEIPEITSAGFKFLLTDRISQLWIYLLNYLKHVEENEAEKLGLNLPGGSENNEPFRHKIATSIVEPLNFLFHLSFCTLGKAYSSKNLSDQMEDFLQQLREVGIVYQRKRRSGWFYPTPLAIGLCSSCATNDLQNERVSSGFLVVETNYRVYAYTDSLLQLAVVSTFTDMIYRC